MQLLKSHLYVVNYLVIFLPALVFSPLLSKAFAFFFYQIRYFIQIGPLGKNSHFPRDTYWNFILISFNPFMLGFIVCFVCFIVFSTKTYDLLREVRAASRLTLRNANRHRLGPNRQPEIFATIYIKGMTQHKTCSHKMVQARFLLSRNRVGRNWNLGSRRVEKKDVPIELQKEMSKIITIVKK